MLGLNKTRIYVLGLFLTIFRIPRFYFFILLPLLLGAASLESAFAASSLSLSKTALPTSYNSVAQTITYSYLVTNTGTDVLTGITINDAHPNLSAIICPLTTLNPTGPNNVTTCSATYSITQADIDAGSVSNTATATGQNPASATITSNVSNLTINGPLANPSLSLNKSSTATNFTVNQTLPYNYLVKNTGNVTISLIHINDPHIGLSAITCPATMLAPNATTTCTATYVATQADVDAGSITNTATALGNSPSGGIVNSPSSSVTINSVAAAPALSLVKSSPASTFTTVGEVIPYSYLVNNTGNVTVSTLVIADNKIPTPITCVPTTLAPGISSTCTGNYTVKLSDLDAGFIKNTATASGKSPTNVNVTSNSATLQINATLTPQLTIAKSSTTTTFNAPGTRITYRYQVTNSGNDTINTIVVSDDKIPAPITCLLTTLAPGASTTCTGVYTTTQTDVDANGVTNIGSVSGKNNQGTAAVAAPTAPYLIPAAQNPSINMSKSTTTVSYNAVGDPISYSFSVTNTGNQTLKSIAIADPMFTTAITCANTTLAPNTTTMCTATYITVQADVDAGSITNTAKATAQNQQGTMSVESVPSTVTIYAMQLSTLNLVKSSSTPPFNSVGQPVQYSYLVTNNGNTSLTTLTISDNKIPSATISCLATSIAPGGSTICTASYTTTQADIDAGGVTNTAQAMALNSQGRTFKSNASTVKVNAIQNPVINMVKTTNAINFDSPNKFIFYTYTVTNNGNDTLYAININDNKVTSNLINCQATTLAPGASTTCNASYETTQADVDAGGVTNSATAAGTNGVGTTVNSAPTQTVTVPSVESPALTLVKATVTPNFNSAGKVLSYSYLVKNTGNVTISFLTVNDNKTSVTCGSTTLAPYTSTNCTATYTTTQADVNAGGITNLAEAVGISPLGLTVTSPDTPDSQLTVSATQMQAVTLAKTSTPSSYTTAGTVITYNYLVTNTGNVTLNPITVQDNRLGAITCPVTSLDPGISTMCTATYTTTAADVSAGSISNVGSVSAVSPIGTTAASSSLTVQGPQLPAITLTKAANVGSFNAAGSTITYFYTLQNTGNVVLSPLTLTDPHAGLSTISCPVTSLNPGAQTTCTATYVTTAADVTNGSISDTATVTAGSPGGPATATSNTLVIPAGGGGLASIALTKSGDPSSYSGPGDTITYVYLVSNTGSVAFAFTLTDNRLGTITCPVSSLAGGATTTCVKTYITTQADVDNGNIANTAIAAGPNFQAISSFNITAVQTPSMTLVKNTPSTNFTGANQAINYNYVVTNTGNLTLTGLVLSDNLISSANLSCPATTIAPGTSITCTGTYTTTQADVDNGSITNTATVAVQQLPSVVTTSKTLPAVLSPIISVTKSTSTPNFNAPNQNLTYSYLVKNLGNDTLSAIVIADNKIPTPITCITTTLSPNTSTVCIGHYMTTQADVDAGMVSNTATVTARNQQGTVVTSTSSVTVFAQLTPRLSLVKTTTSPPFNAPGAVISYQYAVKNTGNTTISTLAISDNKIPSSGISCLAATLAPNATTTCSGTYTTTLSDVDAAGVTNSATAFGRDPLGGLVRSTVVSTTVPAILAPSISMVKSSTTTNFNAPNVPINYSYLVKNTGNDTLSNITLSDNKFPSSSQINCLVTRLAPGASTTCTSIYTTTQADVDNGSVVNTATASAQNPQGTIVTSPQSSVTVPAVLTPRIAMKKSTTATSFDAAGVSIPYSYQVTNTGNETLNAIVITDNKLVSGIICPLTVLPRGMATTCTGVYVTTQADVDAGVLTNTAFASARDNQGTIVNSPNSSVTLIPVQRPAISLQKSTTTVNFNAPGQTINYNYLVTNTGNDTLSTITIADNKITAANIHCLVTTLAPNASTTCTGTYTTTLADVDAGAVTNNATTTGTNPQGVSVTSPISSATVPAILTPAIIVVKSTTTTTFNAVGQIIPYSYKVTNTGNDTLKLLTLNDSKIASTNIHCPVTVLAPNATTTCTANYTVTLADINFNAITNTATAAAKNNQGTSVTSPPSTVTINAVQLPAITLVKSTTVANFNMPGQVILYRYRVTNTGNDTLSGISITDNKVPSGIICPAASLVPNAFTTCTGVYVTTQADVDNGSVTNTATASGTNAQATTVTSQPSSVTVNAIISPMLSLVKSTTTTSFDQPGIVINYNYGVTNNGNETITNISISDSKISAGITCLVTSLAPGISTTCTGSYTTTQADVDDGEVMNLANAIGKNPQGTTIISPTATALVPAILNPALTLTKSSTTTSFANAGEIIPYSYVVTNTGNNALNNIAITDSKIHSGITCLVTSLAPNAATTCSGNYTVVQADIDAGVLTNQATASGRDNQGTGVISPVSSVTINAIQNPALSIVKSSTTANFNSVGQVIPYSYQVLNTGNDTVSTIAITDSKITGPITCPQTILAPNEWTICRGNYTVTQTDIDAGKIINTATATGLDPLGGSVSSPPSTVTINAVLMPALSLVKSTTTTSYNAPGNIIAYQYLVTNTGNDSLSGIAISDSKISVITCAVTSLAPTESTTCTGSYTVVQSDIDAGSVMNLATASGVNAQGTSATSPQASVTVNAILTPSLSLVKSSTTLNYNGAGDSINYRYLVTNTGNDTLANIAIADSKILTGINCSSMSLSPGQSTTCTGTYIANQADVDAGQVSNTATASGQDRTGTITSPPSSVTVNAILSPSLSLSKSSITPSYTAPGDVISYHYLVTNTGNETITTIAISDSKIPSGISCTLTALAPQQFTDCMGTYITTQADVNAGSLINIATASGLNNQGTTINSPPSTVTINAILSPALSLVKSSATTSYSHPGEAISYQYLVTNTGNDTISNITISDTKIPAISCPATPIDPNQTLTCTATYITTQTDVDAGSIMNLAAASGLTPQGVTIHSPDQEFTIPAVLTDGLTMIKSTTTTSFNSPGESIPYSYLVANIGNVTLFNLHIVDDKLPTGITCPLTTLAPSATTTCTGSYLTTQSDVDAGMVTNVANAQAQTTLGVLVMSPQSTTTVNAISTPGLSLVKSTAAANFSVPGQQITYHYLVKNTGNDTIVGLTVIDDHLPSGINCPTTTLAPNNSTVCEGIYTVTQADIDATTVTNTASVAGMTTLGVAVVSNQSAVTLSFVPGSGTLNLVKTADVTSFRLPGTAIVYTYLITNKGVTEIHGLALTDSKLGPITCPVTVLEAGTSTTCTASYVTTLLDSQQGDITNIGLVTGITPNGLVVTATASATVTFDVEYIRKKTMSAIKSFIKDRLQLVLSSEPDRRRIINRLTSHGGNCTNKGPNGSIQPAANSESARLNAAMSLSDFCVESYNFDIWTEAHASYYRQNTLDFVRHGEFFVAYLGLDYLVNPSIVAGILTETDTINRNGEGNSLLQASGQGWMIGPYLSARLAPDLYLHTRTAWGGSGNKLNTFGLYNDHFATSRSLYNAELVGDWVRNRIRISPTLGVSYYSEHQKSFTNFLNVTIPGQSINLGQANVGPEFAYLMNLDSSKAVTLRLSLQGLYNFDYNNNDQFIDDENSSITPFTGRVKIGAEIRFASGLSLTPMVLYDGIGNHAFNSIQAQLQVNVPIG